MPERRKYFRKDGTWIRPRQRRWPWPASVAKFAVAGVAAVTVAGLGTVQVLEPDAARSGGAMPAVAQAGFKRAEAALAAAGYTVSLSTRYDTDCAAHSSGRVREFFTANPCAWLARAYLQVGYSEVLVAISWVGLPSSSRAGKYRRLVDTSGAGNVTELSRETTLYRKIAYTGGACASGATGDAVWNVRVRAVYPRSAAEITRILLASRQ